MIKLACKKLPKITCALYNKSSTLNYRLELSCARYVALPRTLCTIQFAFWVDVQDRYTPLKHALYPFFVTSVIAQGLMRVQLDSIFITYDL